MVAQAFDEIQSSLAAVSARDSIEIRAMTDKLGSDIAALLDHLKEAAGSTRSDLVLAVGNFKADALEEMQGGSLLIHQQDNRLAVGMGAFRTDSENVKLRSVWTYSVVLCLACVLFAAQAKKPKGAGGSHSTHADLKTEEIT